MAVKPLTIWDRISDPSKLLLIAGPCVIEDEKTTLEIARTLKTMTRDLNFNLVFKASFDKANRTSLSSYRGPGLAKGLQILSRVAADLEVPVISDIHTPDQAPTAAEVLDIIQIPAFLCRQTDLILAAARTGKPINLKKGQFLAPWDISPAIAKAASTGNRRIVLTERGTMLGYNNLVVDFRSLAIMADFGYPVVLDVTHSVQIPGGAGGHSTGQRQFAPLLARAAVAAGVGGIFMEVHPDPDRALCDGPNSLPLATLPALLAQLDGIRRGLAAVGPPADPSEN
ncbi:MAG: 3-deoxy-8-phosphooctulonate synthase [Desulfobacterales bacterium]